MRCNREDPDGIYNIIQGWVLRAAVGLVLVSSSTA